MIIAIAPVGTRPVEPGDDAVLRAIYRSTRRDELEAVGWPQMAIEAFCDQQYDLQQAHYRRVFEHLDRRVVLDADANVIGQIAIDDAPDAVTIVDIGFLPEGRGRGIGTQLLSSVVGAADRRGVPVLLTVDRQNLGAQSLYRRLGFETVSTTDLHLHMRRGATGREPE